MNPEDKRTLAFRSRVFLYVAFIAAYISGVVIFIVQFKNYWAASGFSFVIAFLFIRLWLFVTPLEKLYHIFPPLSWTRAVFQGLFFSVGVAFVGLTLFCAARGIQLHQQWKGDTFFCGMTGMAMAAKWSFFLTIPIYQLRPDQLSPEMLAKIETNGDRVVFEEVDCDPYSTERQPFFKKKEPVGIAEGHDL